MHTGKQASVYFLFAASVVTYNLSLGLVGICVVLIVCVVVVIIIIVCVVGVSSASSRACLFLLFPINYKVCKFVCSGAMVVVVW